MTVSTWTTWARQHQASPDSILHPKSAQELAHLIQEADRQGQKLKVLGKGRSSSAIAQPVDQQVTLDYLSGLVSVDQENLTATFMAGTTIRQANQLLGRYKLAFANLGRLDNQTLAGAIATGFHGSGSSYQIFASQVASFTMLDANGQALTCSPTENPDIFVAALCGLGALGVMTQITFRVVPQFRLHAVERGHAYRDIVHTFPERARAADHYKFSWFPGNKEVRTRRLTRLDLLPEGYMPAGSYLSQARRYGGDHLLNNGLFSAVSYAGAQLPAVQPTLNRVSNWAKGNRRYADYSARVFTITRTVRQNNMEYAFDMALFDQVMEEVRRYFEREHPVMSYPLVVRTAAADQIPLSQAYGRETFYISARAYWRQDHRQLFSGLEEVFKAYGGRPHWGQFHTQDAASLAGLYPAFEDFVELRQELDPQGTFLNPYLQRVLLG